MSPSSTTPEITETQFSAIARALADPRRYAILKEIAGASGPLPCCALGEAKKVSAPTISHHIRELEEAGLIAIAREGKFANLSFRREAFDAYLARLADLTSASGGASCGPASRSSLRSSSK